MQNADQKGRYLFRRSKSGGRIGTGGVRPVLVVQNDVGNRFSPTIIVAAVTPQLKKAKLPTHVPIHADGSGLGLIPSHCWNS